MCDTALARRLAERESILEVARATTAERHLDRLLAAAGGARRPTVTPCST